MKNMYIKLKQLHDSVKNQSDLSYRSIPFFVETMREIKVELLKVASHEGEQISRDVTDAMRLIHLAVRDDLNNIDNYPKEIPKYLGRVKATVLSSLAFANKK
jgi:hypothetical protein